MGNQGYLLTPLVVERRRVRSTDTLTLQLARSGGAAIRLRPTR